MENHDYYNVTTNPVTTGGITMSIDMDRNNTNGRRRCVEVQFLRKKTPERGSIDGGIRFYIQPVLQSDGENYYNKDDDDDKDDNTDNFDSDPLRQHRMIELIAKRNSQGQVITKIFAEKLIITNFVASFLGTTNTATLNADINTTTTTTTTTTSTLVTTPKKSILNLPLRYPSPISEKIVQMQSIYHKWM